jgi:nickel superoxide dismutase
LISSKLLKFTNIETAFAHCDVPCGIYDTHLAQVAALTTMRMIQLIDATEAPSSDAERTNYVSQISRYVSTKEEHAELCKKEIRILWADYFRPEHVEKYPELHNTVFNALKTASKVRQSNDTKAPQDLLAAVNQIATIFWATKDVETSAKPSRQAVGGELVQPA